MNLRLENKLALVTASSGGVGARVIINGLSEKSVNTAISSIREVNPEAWLEPLVADSSQLAGAETTLERFPEIDILVSNLGIYEPVGFFEETDESWRRIFEGEHPQRCSPRPSLPGEDAEPENGADRLRLE